MYTMYFQLSNWRAEHNCLMSNFRPLFCSCFFYFFLFLQRTFNSVCSKNIGFVPFFVLWFALHSHAGLFQCLKNEWLPTGPFTFTLLRANQRQKCSAMFCEWTEVTVQKFRQSGAKKWPKIRHKMVRHSAFQFLFTKCWASLFCSMWLSRVHNNTIFVSTSMKTQGSELVRLETI